MVHKSSTIQIAFDLFLLKCSESKSCSLKCALCGHKSINSPEGNEKKYSKLQTDTEKLCNPRSIITNVILCKD